jgi:nitroreductase
MNMKNPIIENIKKRRSIRKFKTEKLSDRHIYEIIESGIWAPSGLNNQPWRFVIISSSDFKEKISSQTKYKKIITGSDTLIAVFFNTESGYNRDKDMMSIGACIQNMLLTAESLGIGSVWLGEILNRKTEVNEILQIDKSNELMAVIALGYPDEAPTGKRKKIDDLILKRI